MNQFVLSASLRQQSGGGIKPWMDWNLLTGSTMKDTPIIRASLGQEYVLRASNGVRSYPDYSTEASRQYITTAVTT